MQKKLCVLLVEDELLVAMVAVEALDELGFEVIEAASAGTALQLAEANKHRIDVALVDLGLPDFPGEQLVSELRTFCPNLPIIIASGKGAGTIDAGVQALQNVTILSKPYDFEELRTAIESCGCKLSSA
jgi:DNA-binding response OmpR family regulator